MKLFSLTPNTDPLQDDANWKQYAVHAPDVPVQKVKILLL